MEGREGPSGPFLGVARLSVSGPGTVAYSAGVTLFINYNQVDYIKGDFGKLQNPLIGGQVCFTMGPGLYLVQSQLQLDAAHVSEVGIGAATGSRLIQSGNDQPAGAQWNQCTANLWLPKSDAAFSPPFFASLFNSLKVTGASGTATPSLLIYKLAGLQ